jgi:tetratricopeptide (TPR) repeat protein
MPRGLSGAEALAARGQFDAAVAWYEDALREAPDDPTPAVHLARLYRDQLGQYQEAISWFRYARRIGQAPAAEVTTTREIMEVFDRKLNAPERAIPELARLSDRFAAHAIGEWAREELRRRLELRRQAISE